MIDVVDDLKNRGIGFVSLTEGFDTANLNGKLVFHILGDLAEFERNLIQERTKAGLEAAMQGVDLVGEKKTFFHQSCYFENDA